MGNDVSSAEIEGALAFISRHVPAIDSHWSADVPPGQVVEDLEERGALADFEKGELTERLAEETDLPPGHALELFHTVSRMLDGTLDDRLQKAFRANLPRDVVATFARSGAVPPKAPNTGHRLADGSPGSSRPLATARPAQADSIAQDDEPKSDTKFSSTEGSTQERKNRTLAEGKPGSTRPISDETS